MITGLETDFRQVAALPGQLNTRIGQMAQRIGPLALRALKQAAPHKTVADLFDKWEVAQVAPHVYEVSVPANLLPGKPARQGIVHYPSGQLKPVPLRATPAADVARFVAEGTGIYKDGRMVRPREASMLLIGVRSAPWHEAYITDNNKIFILRPYARGMRPDPYPERAAAMLNGQLEYFGDVWAA